MSAKLIIAGWAKGVTEAQGAPRERAAERLIHPRDGGARQLQAAADRARAYPGGRRGQGSADHLDPVEPAEQGPVGQHDVGAATFPAARPPRAQAQVAGPITDPAAARVAPGPESSLTDGAPQPPRRHGHAEPRGRRFVTISASPPVPGHGRATKSGQLTQDSPERLVSPEGKSCRCDQGSRGIKGSKVARGDRCGCQ